MTNIFDPNIKELLCELLKQSLQGPVSRKKFRLEHNERKSIINRLEDEQIIKADNSIPNTVTYTLGSRGLYLADCELSKNLFNDIDRICDLLRREYENHDSDQVAVPVKILLDELDMDLSSFLTAFGFMDDSMPFGKTTDLTQEEAVIYPNERLFDFQHFSEIPELMLMGQYPEAFKIEDPNKTPHGNTEVNASKREAILGAAIAVLAKFPEQCRSGKSGKVMGSKVAKLLDEKSRILFPQYDGEAPLAPVTIEREVNKCIKLIE